MNKFMQKGLNLAPFGSEHLVLLFGKTKASHLHESLMK